MQQDHWLHGFNYNVEEWCEGEVGRDAFIAAKRSIDGIF
jgi:hypothetical protein